ncbi:MAG: hypothetical protein M3209_17525 [Acidobacteriota bacterium]|nr:hypothetical protein [Acidobacteriota bacterium]
MSLISFISQPEIRAGFRAALTKQPPFMPDKPMLAPPLTTNYALVGTAFDYLLRFYLERINPNTKTQAWVAGIGILFIEDRETREMAKDVFKDAEKHHQAYLQNGILTDELISASLRLACLDGSARGGNARFNKDGLTHLEEGDIADLRQLMSIVPEQDFKAQKACHLNPTFGFASSLVGGGDADIVIDDKIIDIKTTKNLKLEPKHIHQLVGYYILLSLGGVNLKRSSNINYLDEISDINHLGIYFSRHGYLHKFKTKDLIAPEALSGFVKWFIKSACPTKKELLDYCKKLHGQTAKQLLDEI